MMAVPGTAAGRRALLLLAAFACATLMMTVTAAAAPTTTACPSTGFWNLAYCATCELCDADCPDLNMQVSTDLPIYLSRGMHRM